MKEAINKIENCKAAGTTEITAEILKASGDAGVRMVTDLINTITEECVQGEE